MSEPISKLKQSRLHRGPTSPRAMYWLLRYGIRLLVALILPWHMHVQGRDNVPLEGGLLVISNHIATADPPLLAAVEALAQAGVRTGASARNWASYGADVQIAADLPDWKRDLLTDPQTSGGLLIAVAPDAAEDVLALIRSRGFSDAAAVGRMTEGSAHVRVA